MIAHELAHIRNHDTLLMTITATIAGAISMLAQFGMFFGSHRDNNNGPGIIGSIGHDDPGAVRRDAGADGDQPDPRIRRRRSRCADLRSADVAGVRARKNWTMPRSRSRTESRARSRRPAHMFIINRCRATAWTICSRRIPSTENRIAALQQLAAQIGAQGGVPFGERPRQLSAPQPWPVSAHADRRGMRGGSKDVSDARRPSHATAVIVPRRRTIRYPETAVIKIDQAAASWMPRLRGA